MLLGTSSQLLGTARAAARPACAACRGAGQQRSAHKLVQVKLLEDLPGRGVKGSTIIVSPGFARNTLIPKRKALYVNRHGEVVSPLRDILRQNAEKLLLLNDGLRREEEQRKDREAKAALEQMSRVATSARRTDQQAALREAEKTRLARLARTPAVLFSRLTISPTSSDLFGSVSTGDVLSELRERGFQDFSHLRTAFREEEGIVNGRIKATGTFDFVISSRNFDEEAVVKVTVAKDEGSLGMKLAAGATKEPQVAEETKVVEAEIKAEEKQ
ncbi:ribosomal protein L9 family protein [Rhodotorula toruloides]|uniref:Ribosomal protein L9 family protein n=1 Tax=Rhodotorula toruloides TaxID=5286 RepID=A0A511K9Z1_RHOTO|nr:ribosomal protein L9 family protein [Rhodotorula toruloides]